jgi:HD superfamily phosphodiesterase
MFQESVKVARQLLANTNDKAHDIEHARRVAENAMLIGQNLHYPNLDLLELCGWWHDVGRTINDDGHEKISAELLANELGKQNIDSTIIKSAHDAIVFHKWNMKPKTLEGDIIRDADKLDFISIERWQSCLNSKQPEHLRDMKVLLNQLPQLLKLDGSKKIYLERLPAFKESGLVGLV